MREFEMEAAVELWDETERRVHERGRGYEKDPASMRMEPFRICDSLYYVGDRVVCVHLLDTGKGLVLFDSGFPHAASQLLASIQTLGFSPADIVYVLHTHEHYDHFGASRILQTRYGAKMYLHAEGAETFRIHPHHTEIQSAHCPDAALFVPDVELFDGDVVSVGDRTITCVHTPGHSAGAATYFFELEEKGRRIRVGLCGVNGNLPLHPGRLVKYGIPLASGEEYLASIDRMLEIPVDLSLDTHPRPNGIVSRRLEGADSFTDPAAWGDMLRDYRNRYREMEADFERRLLERTTAAGG